MVEITCPRWQRARHDGLITHERPADLLDDVVLVQGIPCTSVERTLFDIAALGRTRTLELAIDSALRRELTSVDSLIHTGKRLCRRGRIGSALFRAAVATRERSAPLPGSEPERLLAMALVEQGLAQPELQYVVRDPDGAFVARVDLAYPEDRILIEYDSYQEHSGNRALVRDSRRRNALQGAGWAVLVATAEDVRYGQGHALATELRNLTALARQRGS